MLLRLLNNGDIDLQEVERILKTEYELSDEIIQKTIDQLLKPDVTLKELA